MARRNDPCWCGSQQKWKKCHYPLENPKPNADDLRERYQKKYKIYLKNQQEIEGIRQASKLAAQILDKLCQKAVAGVTTLELDDYANQLHREAGAKPAPLGYGYPPFPKSICTSLNEVVCHGIPDKRKLAEGDILNIDVTSILNTYYGDTSRMVCIGKVSEEKKRVVDTSYNCLMKSIERLRPGLALNEIGKAISAEAERNGCSVVYQFVGHGVGVKFHEAPEVQHRRNQNQTPLAPGMIFTIEPMINAGVADAVIDPIDEWTARTKDGKASAQWEHTILITEDSYEILTAY